MKQADHDFHIGCVIMASGASRRFGGGKNKLLELLGEREVILHTAENVKAAGLFPVIVTRSEEVAELVKRNGYECVLHHDPEKSATIRQGLEFLSGSRDAGCLFIPGDQPLIRPDSIRRMMEAFRKSIKKDQETKESGGSIVRLSIKGEGKSPVLFPSSVFPKLLALKGNDGGSALLKAEREEDLPPVLLVEAEEEAELWDCDTLSDLQRIRNFYTLNRISDCSFPGFSIK